MTSQDEPIFVPQDLVHASEGSFSNVRTIENHLLFWHFVDCWPYVEGTNDGWREINDNQFRAVTRNQNSRGKIRRWLENSGFLEFKKYRRRNGELANLSIPGEQSFKYKPIYSGDLVSYHLVSKPPWNYFETFTQDEQLCLATRQNLSLLNPIPGEKPRYADKKAEKKKKNRGISSQKKLKANAGGVKRGWQVRRIFSPWVTCNREVRKCFLLDGCGITAIDLKAAHPTLIAQMSGDQKLARDCQSDALYRGIAQEIGQSRDEAKKAFMAYAYGKNRKDGRGNKAAFLVQEWIRGNYPTAANFITHEKTIKDHEQFSIDLQNLEAGIFVDGIYRELCDLGLPALTVHDAVYFRDRDLAQIKDIAHKHLDKKISKRRYTIEEEVISRPPSRTPPYVHQVSEPEPECLHTQAGQSLTSSKIVPSP